MSGNKRTNKVQTFDQKLTRYNKAIAISCNAKFNDKSGNTAKDWKNGKPIRVLRSYKMAKISKFAPEIGVRYDGIYKVVKYWPEKAKSGFIVWRYLFRRDESRCVLFILATSVSWSSLDSWYWHDLYTVENVIDSTWSCKVVWFLAG